MDYASLDGARIDMHYFFDFLASIVPIELNRHQNIFGELDKHLRTVIIIIKEETKKVPSTVLLMNQLPLKKLISNQ